jgi:hypothetical protein
MKPHTPRRVTRWEVRDDKGKGYMNPPGEPDFTSRSRSEAYARKIGFPLIVKVRFTVDRNGLPISDSFQEIPYRLKNVCKRMRKLPVYAAHAHCTNCAEHFDTLDSTDAFDWKFLHELEHSHCLGHVSTWETESGLPGQILPLRKWVGRGNIMCHVMIEKLSCLRTSELMSTTKVKAKAGTIDGQGRTTAAA